jgi:hypothetical protein
MKLVETILHSGGLRGFESEAAPDGLRLGGVPDCPAVIRAVDLGERKIAPPHVKISFAMFPNVLQKD